MIDEAVYVPVDIIENVVIPMLIVQSGYTVGGDMDGTMSNKLVMASSASYRFNHLYKRFVEWSEKMLEPENTKYFALTLSWRVGVAVNLFKEDFILGQKSIMNNDKFDMEYEGIFPKLMDGSWVTYNDLMACSDLMRVETSYMAGCEYIMSVDVARIADRDNSIINVFKLKPKKDHYDLDYVYTVSMNGTTFSEQAVEIRRVFRTFKNVTRIYMDTNGLGVGLVDELAKEYYNLDDDVWEVPLICLNDEAQIESIPNGLKVIYGIKANAELNHQFGIAIKTYTQKRWIHFYPMNADENRKVDLTSEEQKLLYETEEMRMEMLNIKSAPVSGSSLVRFYSKTRRKDRWSAMVMGVWGAQELYKERNKKEDEMETLMGISRR